MSLRLLPYPTLSRGGQTAFHSPVAQSAGARGRWADRVVASPRFRAWAARFPLTRPIARRRTRALFDLAAGFVYSQVLLACVQVDLFRLLADGPLTEEALARRLTLPPERAARLLRAAISLRLAGRRRDGRIGLGPLGAAMVDNDAVAAMIAHHPMLYADLADPEALLRGEHPGTQLGHFWAYASAPSPGTLDAKRIGPYSALMAASQPLVAAEVLGAYRIDRHRCLLDIGGGEGAFLQAAAARAPRLRLMLFDLPAVADRARRRFAEAGIADRATVVGGDFFRDPPPEGADVVSLVRVIHDHEDAQALAILRAARRALPEDGTLLLAEPMAETRGAEPVGAAYFAFYLLAMGNGRARSPRELAGLLHAAGFAPPRLLPTATPLLTRLMMAKPSSDQHAGVSRA